MIGMDKKRKYRGQVIVYFVLIFSAYLLCFALIVNTAVHVYYKIRLQTAADLGAYAGAAVIANALNPLDPELRGQPEKSIYGLNQKIMEEYNQLLMMLDEHRDFYGEVTETYGLITGLSRAECSNRCNAANEYNGKVIMERYRASVDKIREYRSQIVAIAREVNGYARQVSEQTVKASFGGMKNPTTNPGSANSNSADAILSFFITNGGDQQGSDDLGLFLASEVSRVPFAHVIYGNALGGSQQACTCAPCNQLWPPIWGVPEEMATDAGSLWHCRVNGIAMPNNLWAAHFAWLAATQYKRGNIGTIPLLSASVGNTNWSIPLRIGLNTTEPDPFFMTALEWQPPKLPLDGLFGVNVKHYAVAAAQPFGGDVVNDNPYGVRLAAIRQVLLSEDDPAGRTWPIPSDQAGTPDGSYDFNGVYGYLKKFADGDAEGAVRKFLH